MLELVVYDNVTNDVYMSDLVNGRTDVIINDYYLQSIAVAFAKDKYDIKINEARLCKTHIAQFLNFTKTTLCYVTNLMKLWMHEERRNFWKSWTILLVKT